MSKIHECARIKGKALHVEVSGNNRNWFCAYCHGAVTDEQLHPRMKKIKYQIDKEGETRRSTWKKNRR